MRAHVYVTLKKTVLDAQGKAISNALQGMGHSGISAVRQGKFFEIETGISADPATVRAEVEQIAHEVLANPVIEDYRVEFFD